MRHESQAVDFDILEGQFFCEFSNIKYQTVLRDSGSVYALCSNVERLSQLLRLTSFLLGR